MSSDTAGTQPALAALPLPEYDSLTQDQTRGATCVWDGIQLTGETAVDLGPRRDTEGVWFPRACRLCAQRQAMDALIQHSGACEQCVDDHTRCPEGSTLVRAVREARR
ncbi:hypothetical protein AB0E62_27560 [Streptomyces sp. NPDC038707]|uniref:hypothetical protein n=1 Tax=Streptomyces sp. NPDC038707 TaxID=3154329 RepID=UPI003401F00D